jgi:hypothetical protein
MRNDPDLLRTERTLWRGATTIAIGILLLMMLQTRAERRDAATPRFGTPRFDEPGSYLFIPPSMPEGGRISAIAVFRSIDNGETWRSLDGSGPAGLLDIPVHLIVVDATGCGASRFGRC